MEISYQFSKIEFNLNKLSHKRTFFRSQKAAQVHIGLQVHRPGGQSDPQLSSLLSTCSAMKRMSYVGTSFSVTEYFIFSPQFGV